MTGKQARPQIDEAEAGGIGATRFPFIRSLSLTQNQ